MSETDTGAGTEAEAGTEADAGTEAGTEAEGAVTEAGSDVVMETQDGSQAASHDLVFFMELDGLGDAHFIGSALDTAGIRYRIAKHRSHAFDIAISHGWGMLYVAHEDFERVKEIVLQVREDESSLRDVPDDEHDDEGDEEA